MFEGFALERVDCRRGRRCGCATAARVRRSCCCTGTRARTPRGTGWRRCWRGRLHRRLPGPARLRRSSQAAPRPPTTRPTRKRAMAGDVVALMRAARARAVRGGRPRPRQLRRVPAGDGPPGRRHAPRGAGRRADRRGAGALRRPVRRARGGTGSSSRSPTSPSGRSSPTRTPGTAARPERMGRGEPTPTTGAAIHDPATVRAMLEDYRAGLGVDRAHDEADRAAGRRVALPDAGAVGAAATTCRRSTATRWRSGGRGRRTCAGAGIDCGHHMAEEAPEELGGGAAGVPGLSPSPQRTRTNTPPEKPLTRFVAVDRKAITLLSAEITPPMLSPFPCRPALDTLTRWVARVWRS